MSRHSKVVWSIYGENLESNNHNNNFKNFSYDALRLIYSKKSSQKILSFLKSHDINNPIIMDVSHQPQATLSNIKEPFDVIYDQTLNIGKTKSDNFNLLLNNFYEWHKIIEEDALVYLDCGNVILKVLKINEASIITTVIQGGTIQKEMEVHIPQTRKLPSIFDLSFIDIKPYQNLGIDYVILPGIINPKQIVLARKRLQSESSNPPWLLIKIDCKEVYTNISTLLDMADGVLISRRELALTVEPALVPIICKEIIHECNMKAKLALVSSDMLGSMKKNFTPTRAEVSDIANAVIDGIDAVVLSGDITKGPYAKRSLDIAAATIVDIESHLTFKKNWKKSDLSIVNEYDAVSYNAFKTAERVKAKAIVCFTKEGNTALKLASFRPTIQIIAITFCPQLQRKLSLIRGVKALCLEKSPKLDDILPTVKYNLKKGNYLLENDTFVFVTVTLSSLGKTASNLFTIQEVN